MGQGGMICVINATPYDWDVDSDHQYQMEAWDSHWPSVIRANTAISLYIEFESGVGIESEDDQAHAYITVRDGRGSKFDIYAWSNDSGHSLWVRWSDIDIKTCVRGDDEWMVNYVTPGPNGGSWATGMVILTGRVGEYYNSPGYVEWMPQLLPRLGNLNLRQLCLPKSHDSGMSCLNSRTAFAMPSNTITQYKSIRGQLDAGIRYFDLRPVITSGNFAAGHYSHVSFTWQGGNGQWLSDIINEINDFTRTHPDLIIFELSHAYDTDRGNSDYPPLSNDQWKRLFTELSRVNNRYVASAPNVDLTTIPLKTFIGGGKAAVIFTVSDDNVDIGSFRGQGFYYGKAKYNNVDCSQLNYNGGYSDSDDANWVRDNQLSMLRNPTYHKPGVPFLSEWTLTMAGFHNMLPMYTIKDGTTRVLPELWKSMLGACSKTCYPNMISHDYVNSDLTVLCIAINLLFAAPA